MLERWIARHWIALCAGCVLMGVALRTQYSVRGRMSFGGEWFIIPFMFMMEYMIRTIKREVIGVCRNSNRNCVKVQKKTDMR